MNPPLYTRIAQDHGESAIHLCDAGCETRTFLGGVPLSSSSFEWPRKDGRPLGFIGQVELSELDLKQVAPWLPLSGRILFFYDMERFPWGDSPMDHGGWFVSYEEDPADRQIPFPDDLDVRYQIPNRKYLRGRAIVSMPSLERIAYSGCSITEDEAEEYEDNVDASYGRQPRHQMGGYPSAIQDDGMEDLCQLVTGGVDCRDLESMDELRIAQIRREENDWKLLLQVDSDDDLELMWGDAGRLFFWIRESDARARDFSKVWIQIQCS